MFEAGLVVLGLGGVFGILALRSWLAVAKHRRNARWLADAPVTTVAKLDALGSRRAVIRGKVASGHLYTEPLEGRQVAFFALRVLRYVEGSGSASGSTFKPVLSKTWGDDLVIDDGTGSVALSPQRATYAFYWNWKGSHLLTEQFESIEHTADELPEMVSRICDREGVRTRSLLGKPERIRVQQFSLKPGIEVTVSGYPSETPDEKGRPLLEPRGKKTPLYLADISPEELSQRLLNWGGQRRLNAIVLSILSPLFLVVGGILLVAGM